VGFDKETVGPQAVDLDWAHSSVAWTGSHDWVHIPDLVKQAIARTTKDRLFQATFDYLIERIGNIDDNEI
ncbi:uncharacterized protein METZ01_LOCUS103415, partial [marine metagenome]